MAKVNGIVFTQAQDNTKAVVADRYVAHALLMQNTPIYEALGGKRVEGINECRIVFPSVAKAKKFIEQAITGISKKEYNATRKVRESKPASEGNKKSGKGNKKPAKGNEVVTLVDAEGNEYVVPKSALPQAQAQAQAKAKKSKGNATPTKSATTTTTKKSKPASTSKGNALSAPAQKTLDAMKKSILNRAASAYSIAHGGEATTFDRLGKSEKAIKEFMPAAKAGLLKSSKWAKAVKEHGLTEAMLG